MSKIEVILQPRIGVGELIDKYAKGLLNYDELYREVRALGYSCNSLYEMVCHIVPKKKEGEQKDEQ